MAGALRHERRASPRLCAFAAEGLGRARLRPGRIAHVIDLSPGGALIETDWRLLPGLRVEMQIGEPAPLFRIAGRILRCHVFLLGRERIRYRGALAFDELLPLWEVTTQWPKPHR